MDNFLAPPPAARPAAAATATTATGPVAIGESAPFLGALWQVLKARWWLPALAAVLGLVAAMLWLRTADYRYTAQFRVAAAEGASSSSGRLGSLAGLAAIAGVGLETEASPFRLYLEDLTSRGTADALAADPALLHSLFPEEWTGSQWQPRPSLTDRARAALLGLAGAPLPAWVAPDGARVQSWLQGRLGVLQTERSPVVTLLLDHPDPAFAKALLVRLHRLADARARARVALRARQNIAHLDARLPRVPALDYAQAIITTRALEEQRLMMARNPAPFAAEPQGAPVASAGTTSPRPVLVLALGLLAGLVIGTAAALLGGPLRRPGR